LIETSIEKVILIAMVIPSPSHMAARCGDVFINGDSLLPKEIVLIMPPVFILIGLLEV